MLSIPSHPNYQTVYQKSTTYFVTPDVVQEFNEFEEVLRPVKVLMLNSLGEVAFPSKLIVGETLILTEEFSESLLHTERSVRVGDEVI